MRDTDTKLLEEKYESLFSGKIEEEKDDTSYGADDSDDSGDDKEEEKDDSSSDSDSDDSDSDSSDSDSSDSDSDDSDSDDSDSDDSDSDSDSGKSGGDSGIQSKVKQLQKQYNDLLVDAFEKYAAECIENALDGVESSFGENITDILDGALQELKGKILGDLGVEDIASDIMGGEYGDEGDAGTGELGGMEVDLGDEPEVEFGSEVGGVPTMSINSDEEEVEEGCDSHPKKKRGVKVVKVVKESTKVADYYGFA
jgi:hypothetical protein